jgi:mRNA interferase RelE/StbE
MAKRFILIYTEQARNDLLSIERSIAQRIYKKLEEDISIPDPLQRAKMLQGELAGVYRLRVGDYRVLFEVNKGNQISVLMILKVMHRKDIYRQLLLLKILDSYIE